MRTIPIAQISDMSPGETVPSIVGTLRAAYPQSRGQTDKGPWSVQNMILADGQSSVKVKLWDHDAVSEAWVGKAVCLHSHESQKGLTGLKVESDTYKGVTSKIIKATATAVIVLAEASETAPASAPDPAPASAPAPAPAHTPVPAAPANGNGKQRSDAEHALAGWAKLYLRCMDAADHISQERSAAMKAPLTSDSYQACVSALFIQATRNGHNNI